MSMYRNMQKGQNGLIKSQCSSKKRALQLQTSAKMNRSTLKYGWVNFKNFFEFTTSPKIDTGECKKWTGGVITFTTPM